MTDAQLKQSLSIVRNWLIEIGHTLPPSFAEHVAIITGELHNRINPKPEKDHANLDH